MADYSLSINNLDLSVRTYYCLHRAGLFTVGLIVQKSAEDLLELPQFSRRCLAELRSKLLDLGFRDPWPEWTPVQEQQSPGRGLRPVEALDIWPRTKSALAKRGIDSVAALLNIPGDDLLDFLSWEEVQALRRELISLDLMEPGNIERGETRGPG